MVPTCLEYEDSLEPWLTRPRINPRAVCYAVVRMLGRLGRKKEEPIHISKLLWGLSNKNLPYLMLKDLVMKSGFFMYENGFVRYNWEQFREHERETWSDTQMRYVNYKVRARPFVMVPEGLENDPRLQPWIRRDHVSPEALCYSVICMMERLAMNRHAPVRVDDLIFGLNTRNISVRLLRELVLESGFFNCSGNFVLYDWERFTDVPQSGPNPAPIDDTEICPEIARKTVKNAENASEVHPKLLQSDSETSPSTYAREILLNKINKQKKEKKIETESLSVFTRVDGGEFFADGAQNPAHSVPDSPVETSLQTSGKTSGAESATPAEDDGIEARIHKMIEECDYLEENALEGWHGDTLEARKHSLEQRLLSLLKLKDSKLAEIVGNNLGMKDYKEKWRDIVLAYIQFMVYCGYLGKLHKPGKVNIYFMAHTRPADPKARGIHAAPRILNYIRQNRRLREKERFPFEDYNMKTGKRSFNGQHIPFKAPPRPDNNSWWNADKFCWEHYGSYLGTEG